MKSWIFAIAALGIAGNAIADWTKVGEAGDSITYAAIDEIERNGTTAKMWSLFDFQDPREDRSSGSPYLSQIGMYEFECEQKEARILFYSRHSGHMGEGETVFSRDLPDNDWRPVPAGSLRETEWSIACGHS